MERSCEKKNIISLLCFVLLSSLWQVNGYRVCDSNSDNSVAQDNVADHIDRLMQFRKSDWSWMNIPEAFLALQLSDQQAFFGRNRTFTVMQRELINEYKTMNIGKLALYIMAVKSACEDPRNFAGKNLLVALKRRIRKQFPITGQQLLPEDRWYRYSLAVGAECISGNIVKPFIIDKFVRGQNKDGSFGGGHSADDTSQAVLALACVNRQKLRKKVTNVISKAVNFLRNDSFVMEGNKMWMGNKYSTPAAVLALKESGMLIGTTDCRPFMDSLNKPYISNEFESAFSQRLPALAGKSYLELAKDWICIAPDAVPLNYQPDYDIKSTPSCDELDQPNGVLDVDVVVSLKVYSDIAANISVDQPNLAVNVTIKKGGSLLDAMTKGQCLGLLRFQSTMSSWGASITSVEGGVADQSNREFWSLLHADGSWLSTGASNYLPSHAEVVILKLSTW